ncbi:YbhB/YbcL family Raf kinase inhibitor-like protein [Agromyces atrinae]|uniref:YbhB/YbcL family Raf kinase inhibitor-like protein n=1 Tax=Agromyces atrinae TaxID=592376 RepID=UPI001F592749|nr:YbhB/YbcL family Raf kinase inhibitor-like protein [Agromyces atrinae]MCI2957558.1 YbhB/YbcL family Raf kinase inhibitor-like protein [Agromyces atrinae]
MTTPHPTSALPAAPAFSLVSETVTAGGSWPEPQFSGIFGVPGGQDRSPQLSWTGAPAETKSYAVTIHDPDAPTGSGFWHWAVVDIPASVTELAEGAGDESGERLPAGAYQLRNDAAVARYIGAAPPAGDAPHRYVVIVTALDVEQIGVGPDATPALLALTLNAHVLGRAVLVATAQVPALV